MIDPRHNYKQIEDIIDERKKLGQYDLFSQSTPSTPLNCRYAYSAMDKFIRFDETTMMANEGDCLNSGTELKPTDSEITIVRVRCGGLTFKRRPSKWDMHDVAVPGDGSHLGESPSMVNLATLVEHNEYLVPLSSWDPYCKSEEPDEGNAVPNRAAAYACDTLRVEEVTDEDLDNSSITQFSEDTDSDLDLKNLRRTSLAGRISKFLRKHCRKAKTLPEDCQPDSNEPRPSK